MSRDPWDRMPLVVAIIGGSAAAGLPWLLGASTTPDGSYYSAVSAVIPLLLIAVLGTMSRGRARFASMVEPGRGLPRDLARNLAKFEEERQEIQRHRRAALTGTAAGREVFERLSDMAASLEDLTDLRQRIERTAPLFEDARRALNQSARLLAVSTIVVTLVAAYGEFYALSALASDGSRDAAFEPTVMAMGMLPVNVLVGELAEWQDLFLKPLKRATRIDTPALTPDRPST